MPLCDICGVVSTQAVRIEYPTLCNDCLSQDPEPALGLRGQLTDQEVAQLEASVCSQEGGSMVILSRKSVLDLFDRLHRLETAVAFAAKAQLDNIGSVH
ncbi:MAG: hypothetical protein M3T49_09530 [Candidatus Eremiobacteraeota bacterium]|nr:hypothetical protein [Candidatus Eremiobacteraeota bacterium]